MGQSLVNNLVQLIYSTKNRKDMISPAIADRLWRYQAGVFQECESPAIIIGGMPDHIHALFRLSKNLALRTVVEEVKKASSKWMKAETDHDDFYWQAG